MFVCFYFSVQHPSTDATVGGTVLLTPPPLKSQPALTSTTPLNNPGAIPTSSSPRQPKPRSAVEPQRQPATAPTPPLAGLATNSFFSVSFLWKIIDLPVGQINDPSSGKHYSLPFLPATPLSLSQTLEGLFELTRRPSRGCDLPRVLHPELQNIMGTGHCQVPGVPRCR